jgi:hypothetical protein
MHLGEELAALEFGDVRFGRAIGDGAEWVEAGET